MESRGRGVLDTRWNLSSGSPKARPGGGYDDVVVARFTAGDAVICPSANQRLAPRSKIFRFAFDPNQQYIAPRPVPHEGRLAIVTDAERDAVDAAQCF
jgi:hypothetical protein